MQSVQSMLQDHKWALDASAALAALLFAVLAFRLRDRPRLAVCLAIASGTAIALAMSMDDFLHPWDERYHAVVARHLIRHPLVPTLYEETPLPMAPVWGSGQVWIHKPPLPLWLMGATLRLLGTCELAIRLPSVLLLALCAYATARIGATLLDERVGLLAAFLVAINGNLLDLASGRKPTDHTDSLLTSLTCLAVWSAVEHASRPSRRRAALTGLLAGLAVLAKWLIGLLPFAVWLVLLRRRRDRWPDLLLGLAVCALVATPWQLYVSRAFPAEAAFEATHRIQHLFEPLDAHTGGPLFYLIRIPRTFGELSPLAIVWFAWRRRAPALLVWAALPYAFFSLVATKLENYVMPAAPAVALMVAWAAVELWRERPRWMHLLAASLVLLPVRYAVERWKPFRRFEEERAVARALRALPSGRVLVVGARHPIETMFYGDRAAYAEVPQAATLERLRAEGWRIIEDGP
jgi:4-amino-4-deoxy-L-arabinose transferase-like glycosyltransferase